MPRRLHLERAEGLKVSVRLDDAFHRGGAVGANELVFQVSDADVEAQPLHVGEGEVRAQAGPFEAASEFVLFLDIAEARQPMFLPWGP